MIYLAIFSSGFLWGAVFGMWWMRRHYSPMLNSLLIELGRVQAIACKKIERIRIRRVASFEHFDN